jgi:predicted transcriptional regulator/DNA-binding XRE family transcriptional regulator
LRQARRERGLTQAALAAKVGISPSYLNLIEHGKREVAGTLLIRLAGTLGLEIAEMTGVETTRLVHDLGEIAADPLLGGLGIGAEEASELVGRHPAWGRAMVKLHRSYRAASTLAQTLAERLSQDETLLQASHELLTRMTSVRSFAEILRDHPDVDGDRRARFTASIAEESAKLGLIAKALFDRLSEFGEAGPPTTPAEEVDDFIADRGNHFPELEAAAEAMAAQFSDGRIGVAKLVERLRRNGVRVAERREAGELLRDQWFDAGEWMFRLTQGAAPASIRFEMARALFAVEQPALIERAVAAARLNSEEARRRAGRALCGYGAGALLMPYAEFRKAAEAYRYDIDRLGAIFAASFEQICHRLVTLRRPGDEGIPFAFLRIDPAGNISKRFGLPDLRLPRHGGVCPLWAVYKALEARGALVTQRARLSDRREFLFVARSVCRSPTAFGAPAATYSIMLGCEAAYVGRFIYGDGLSAAPGLTLETGVNCHLCPREACAQRAFPQVLAPT